MLSGASAPQLTLRALAALAAAIALGVVGWGIARATYPSHEDVHVTARALVPPAAENVHVWAIDGWELLNGPFRVYAEFEAGAMDRSTLVHIARERAVAEGWRVAEAVEHPGAVELPISREAIVGTISLAGPPSISSVGGRVRLLYAEDFGWRDPAGALIGAAFGGIVSWLALGRLTSARKSRA